MFLQARSPLYNPTNSATDLEGTKLRLFRNSEAVFAVTGNNTDKYTI